MRNAMRTRWMLALAPLAFAGCDKAGSLADLDSGPAVSPVPTATVESRVLDAAPSPAPTRAMPPRPVPTSSPTVRITMPQEVQLEAIQYMAAMQAPQPSDAPADPAYANAIAGTLRPLGKVDVISGGRQIEISMPKGCDASLPRTAIARQTGAVLGSLLAHGVLVIKCIDHEVQCLQSTRDADDVLCTHR